MYEHMLENYGVFFEGLPEPVIYERNYPMGSKEGPYGSSLWDEFNYGRGLKKDRDPNEEHYRRFADQYETGLRRLLNTVMADSKGMRRGVVVIPASTRGEVSRVTELARRVLAGNPRMFADLTRTVTRSRTKSKAHAGGSRSLEGFDTIGVSRDAGLGQYDVILVVDDILTTGTSFRAMGDRLRASGFAGAIVNFAFANWILAFMPGSGADDGATRDAGVPWVKICPSHAVPCVATKRRRPA